MQRSEVQHWDTKDPLAFLRQQFSLPDGIIYLDGNSLGPLPVVTSARVARVLEQEWGRGLIRSWNEAGWITLAHRVGEKIAKLIGAGSGEVIATDSTSVNLFKVLAVALRIAQQESRARTEILSEAGNFPTDLYIAQGLADFSGRSVTVRMVAREQLLATLSERTAVLMLTQVNYKTGQLWDMRQMTQAAHAAGALMVWDLAHSAGALPVELKATNADFAVGCGYKYLNGGPGAPAFVWVHPRHMQQGGQPLSGWLGHAAPFAFTADYSPAQGIHRYLCGTPAILSLAALDCGVDSVLAAETAGGMRALRDKSEQLTQLFIELVEQHCGKYDLKLASPRSVAQRGSQVSFSHEHAYPIMQALIARGVIGDFRAPDILRFGFAPLYTRFVDVWDAVQHLVQVLQFSEWQQPRFAQRNAVT